METNFPSLLMATVHSLDNPMGSLSTTFEAIQALMKLGSQLKERMRDTASVWGPPIYRRLVSSDKRARDMSERCLLKLKPIICPPSLSLSKALVLDMKKRLLPGMKELQNQGLNIQAVQAWGWYIQLLGSYAKKNRQLVNEMLKILEQTFSSVDSQVQIASMVAWEGLIDALIHPITESSEMNNQMGTFAVEEGTYKSLKLIMTPLIGIMSSKCDLSVHSSCLSSWCFLLHKLGTTVNCPSVLKLVWNPIFDAVFLIKPEGKNILVSNICLDLLEMFISANIRKVSDDLNEKNCRQFSPKLYPINWLPWTLGQLDFFMKTIGMLMNQGYTDEALRVLRRALKGVQNMLKSSNISYDEVMVSVNTILGLGKEIHEGNISKNRNINSSNSVLHSFVEVVIGELEPSILGSPLYKVALDLKYINKLQSICEPKDKEILKVGFTSYKEMVSPIVYLTLLYLCESFSYNLDKPDIDFIFRGTLKFINNVFSSYEPLEILNVSIGLLYKHKEFHNLKMWIAIADGIRDYINEVKDISFLKPDSKSPYRLAMCYLLSYPFVACSYPQKQVSVFEATELEKLSTVSLRSQRRSELENVIKVWNLLYVSINGGHDVENSNLNSFTDDLLETLNEYLGSITKVVESNTLLKRCNDAENGDFTVLSGNVSICILEHILKLENSPKGRAHSYNGDQGFSGTGHALEFVARFLELSLMMSKLSQPEDLSVISRVFLALVQFVGGLHYKKDILSFVQVMSNPLLQWLTCSKVSTENLKNRLELLWGKTLNSLLKSNPPIIFDSNFLKNHSRLFEKTLDHPNPSISDPSITFWNSTFAMEANLDYPQNLLAILDKLSRKGKIQLYMRKFPSIQKCTSKVVHNMSSKIVELVGNKDNEPVLKVKRKRRDLTEHQREVRRAQQGRERDCGGHGPGVRMYTGCDFSLGNDESQDSQDIDLREAESILERLRRDS